MTCERCGCSELNACALEGDVADSCSWVRPGLCSACVTPEEWREIFAALEREAAGGRAPSAAELFAEHPVPLLFDAYGRPAR